MASLDWDSNQGSGKLRGLSGGSARWVHLDDANSFFNFRLRQHYTDDEIADDPTRLWRAHDDEADPKGLVAHVADALAEGQRFTDVLIVLSEDDYDACVADDGEFAARLSGTIDAAYRGFREGAGLPPVSRPLGVRLARDGGAAIGGHQFGLVEGEFVTGIIPNLYAGPAASSQAIIGLHVNIPGHWEGYREVGNLYDDQVMFTLGNHWLDNLQHPHLEQGALYQLERSEDGGFFHIINRDLQGRYQLTSTEQGGTSVITLATRTGQPLAYLVLAVNEPEDVAAEPEVEEPAPAAFEAPAAPAAPAPDVLEDVPAHAAPEPMVARLDAEEAPDLNVLVAASKPRAMNSKTIVPEASNDRIFTLQERGALLQKVHFSAFMLGYDVYVGFRGEMGTVVDRVAATFQVRKKTVSLLANADIVSIDGEAIPAGESRLIEGDVVIQVGNQRLDYRELRGVDVDGWPYVGEIRRPASSTYMLWGRDYTIGRSRDSRVVLPDEPRNDNIVWKPKVGDGAAIKSKTGEIPKSRFYTDSIMVASDHAAIELLGDQPTLSCHARHCYTFIRRGQDVVALHPSQSTEGVHQAALEPGDEVLIGNCVFHVGFAAGEDAVAPAPAPRLSTDSLVDAVSAPEFDMGDEDAPAAFGLPSVDDAPHLDNLPSLSEEDPPAPPKLEPVAEASLSAAQRSMPDAQEAELQEVSDAPPAAPSPAKHASRTAPPRTVPPVPGHGEGLVLQGGVVVVDDHDAQFELGRPARLVQVGWAVNGSVICGNHAGCDLVIPENRIDEDQAFEVTTYFEIKVRGKRARLSEVHPDEVRIDGAAPQVDYDDASTTVISIIRRDDEGEEDFTVDLSVQEEPGLPDPRARLIAIDTSEPLAVALMTRGFPVRAPRTLPLNGLVVTGTFDGSAITLSDYLDGYKLDDGFLPFFVQGADGRFRTAPEDGSAIVLEPGTRIVVDGAVFRFDVP